MFKVYYPVVRKCGDETVVSIKTHRGNGDLELAFAGISALSFVFIVLSLIQIFKGKGGNEIIAFIFLWTATTAFLLRDRIALLRVDKSERGTIRKLADFIWQNRLYSLNELGEIDYAVQASYKFEGTDLVISLNAIGTEYAKQIQEKEIALQSLFPRLRFVDKRIFNDRTDYVFTLERDNRIYVN